MAIVNLQLIWCQMPSLIIPYLFYLDFIIIWFISGIANRGMGGVLPPTPLEPQTPPPLAASEVFFEFFRV